MALMHEFMEQQGYAFVTSAISGLHHEIYLSDARKISPENLKTVIRIRYVRYEDGITQRVFEIFLRSAIRIEEIPTDCRTDGL